MAAGLHVTGSSELWDGTIDILTVGKLKAMLLDNVPSYTFDPDDDLVDGGGANDPADAEVSGTGYTGGYGGSGRKALSSRTITVDKANNRSAFDCADVTWTGIDVGEVGAMEAIIEDLLGTAGNDAESRLVMYDDTNFPLTTNGGDLTLQVGDLIRLAV